LLLMPSILESPRARGMRDLLPDEMERFRRVEQAFHSTCESWGFREIRTPVIEYLHLFTSAGTLSPQMLGRAYSFLDWDGWSGERVVLRPDATIPTARLYREHFTGQIGKFFYVQNIFRFATGEEEREIWQCGAELIGDTWPLGDVEVITVARGVLLALGLHGVTVRLSRTGLVRAILVTAGYTLEEQLALYDRILDGEAGVVTSIEERLPQLGAPLHLLFESAGAQAGYLANLRGAFAVAVPSILHPLDELQTVVATLQALQCPYELDLTMVRDFEYYTGPIFHLVINGHTVAMGGRYDSLVSVHHGEALPACGFAIDVERVAELLPARDMASSFQTVQVRPARGDAEDVALAIMVTIELQGSGFRAELIAPDQSPACRWRLTVDPRSARPRYELEDCTQGTGTSADSMEQIMTVLNRVNRR
ncbi:MAG: ATP phosphoribosyltransferase regulatory subunit, partial [Dehalococcoidia bacterium]